METKKNKIKNLEKIQAPQTPSAVDDARMSCQTTQAKRKSISQKIKNYLSLQ